MSGGLGADTVTVRRTVLVATDRYGKESRDWSAPVEHAVAGVSVQPVSVSENTVDREWASTHLVMYAPAGADIVATDRVVWRGATYEVDGPPQIWIDDHGVVDHVAVSLKLMTG